MPGNVAPEYGCPYDVWPGPGVFDFPDWMQMLLNSVWAMKGSMDALNTTLNGTDGRGIKVDLGTVGDYKSRQPNFHTYDMSDDRALDFSDLLHWLMAFRGLHRDPTSWDLSLFFWTQPFDRYEPGRTVSEGGYTYEAWNPYSPIRSSLESIQGYEKGFLGEENEKKPMSLGRLDEAGWKTLFDDIESAKQWVDLFVSLLDLIPSLNIDLPDLSWLLEVARAGGSVADAVRQMQIREEGFLAAQRKRSYFQLMIAQNEAIVEELRKLQGIPAYQRDLDPGVLAHDNAPVDILKSIGVWDDLPQWVRDHFPYTDDQLNPHYGDYVALDGDMPPEANLQTWTDAGGEVHRTVKDPQWAKFRYDQFDYARANLLSLRGTRPKVRNGELSYHERATLQDILDALAFAPKSKDPSKPVKRGSPYNPHPDSDGESVPVLDPDEILDLALPEQQAGLLDWWNTFTGTADAAGDVGDILVDLGTDMVDQVTDVGIIAATGGTAIATYLNMAILINIATHLAGNPLRTDGGYMNIAPAKPVRQTLDHVSRSLYGETFQGGTTPPEQEDQMLTQMRNKIDTLETHVDELEAKLDALLEVLA